MDAEANKALVRRYFDMWNSGDATSAAEILASDYVDYAHPEPTGPAVVVGTLPRVRAAFPDFHIAFETMIAEADTVAIRASITRTMNGQPTTSRVMWFVRIADGKMAELWTGSES